MQRSEGGGGLTVGSTASAAAFLASRTRSFMMSLTSADSVAVSSTSPFAALTAAEVAAASFLPSDFMVELLRDIGFGASVSSIWRRGSDYPWELIGSTRIFTDCNDGSLERRHSIIEQS